jgi:SAM-dependent MidA family methyltransferase
MQTTTLQQLIAERIEREGPLTFADYMRMALYEPDYGYYVTGSAKMGWAGDYYTSTDVSVLFAHCIGRQLMQMWEQLGRPDPFTVLEQGAGRGDLASQVRSWAAQEACEFEAALVYHTTDIYGGMDALNLHAMTAVQAEQVMDGREAQGEHEVQNAHETRHRRKEQDRCKARSLRGPHVILANELLDAFPVHVVEKRGETLQEIYVDVREGKLCEVWREIASEEVASYLDNYKIPWRTYRDGWRAEINLDAVRWVEQVVRLLVGPNPRRKRRGFLLTIDYGDIARELYTPYRRRGTLASYFKHQFTEQPLARPGAQDLTAHVNFTALVRAGRQHGLRLGMLTTQRQWLTDLGIYEELERVRRDEFAIVDQARASDEGQVALLKWYDLRQRVMALTARSGMGDFKVLIMKR